MQLSQEALSLMCIMACRLGEHNACICVYVQLWKKHSRKDGRRAWAWAAIRTTVSKAYQMPFLSAGGASISWSNRKNTVRFGEETWCLLCTGDRPWGCCLILWLGQGLIVPVWFLVRATALFRDQRHLPSHIPQCSTTFVTYPRGREPPSPLVWGYVLTWGEQ